MKKGIDEQQCSWWHKAIGYQIYPKSFQDSNNDGIGDLRGIINRLDYLENLGINLIWICPVYKSPMMDHGYDISDYETIDDCFGNNEDIKDLIKEAGKRGIKVLMDLVLNHTSDQHPWFQEAIKNLDGEYAKYYIIKEGMGDQPPNDWKSIFGGSAWERIEGTNRYYLHLFTKGQPDLNWENEKLRKELYGMINRWLELGLSGFRVDAISHIKKNFDYKNRRGGSGQTPPADKGSTEPTISEWDYYNNVEGLDVFLHEMKEQTFKRFRAFTVAEIDNVKPEKLKDYIGEDGYFSTIFDFCHTSYRIRDEKWINNPIEMIEEIKHNLFQKQEYAKACGFLCNFIENHDLPRAADRFIPEKYIDYHSLTLLGAVNFFLKGIPFIYQGQEIGMRDFPKNSIEEYKDPTTYRKYEDYLAEGMSQEQAWNMIQTESREHSRTPMQWSEEIHAGFTAGKPWFEVNPNYKEINCSKQQKDEHSVLSFYKKMIAVRKRQDLEDCLIYGETVPRYEGETGVIAYERIGKGSRILAIHNCNPNQVELPFYNQIEEVVLDNYALEESQTDVIDNKIRLMPFQTMIIKLKKPWWKDSVVYQIYPRSFQDSNGDGIGDLQGIISRLDYLSNLGIDAVWLSPICQSPQDDNGYDISDYQAIDSVFGTMEDMERLIDEGKKRGISILLDLVLNHSSDEHKWFIEAKKGRDNPYHDYYIWRDGSEGAPPNDMKAAFGGSAWEWVPELSQYYFHQFSVKQPDLNWENPKVRKEIYQMILWWMDKGIGGFRLDVIDQIAKEPDNGITQNGSRLHEFIRELSRETFQKGDLITVGEAWGADIERAKQYSNPDGSEFSMVFQFEHIGLDQQAGKEKWDLAKLDLMKLKKVFSKWQKELHHTGWNSLFWNNHDLPRIVSRWGDDSQYREESAKMLALLLHGLEGTPYIYQGEELGMTNVKFGIEDYRDIETLHMYQERLENGYDKKDIMLSIHAKSRDNARTPMQWDNSSFAGFSTCKPWIEVNPNYESINAKDQQRNQDSVFWFYKRLIQLRKEHEVIVDGDFQLLFEEDKELFAYKRTLNNQELVVVCNFYGISKKVDIRCILDDNAALLISNYETNEDKQQLRPFEARMYLSMLPANCRCS